MEHDSFAQFRMPFQRVADRAQAFRNSFTIIEAVPHPGSLAIGKRGAQLLRSRVTSIGHCALFKRVEVDPNWKMPEANLALFKRTNCSRDEERPCI